MNITSKKFLALCLILSLIEANCIIVTPLQKGENLEVLPDMSNKLGRQIVDLYYKDSPCAARLIENHCLLKLKVRVYLIPIVILCYSLVHLGPSFTTLILFFILSIFLISFFRRRMN